MKNILISIIAGLIAVCLVIIIYHNTNTLYRNFYDDAFISMRYSVNLAEGKGLVYNEGERTDAASSFLYTIVLAGFYRVGFHNLEAVSFFLNIISIGVIAGFVYLSGIKLLEEEK